LRGKRDLPEKKGAALERKKKNSWPPSSFRNQPRQLESSVFGGRIQAMLRRDNFRKQRRSGHSESWLQDQSRRTQRDLVLGIHIEDSDRCSAGRSLSDQINSVPLKMIVPILPPRMKQICNLVRFRIDTRQVCPLVRI